VRRPGAGGGGRRRSGTLLFCVILSGLTLGALGHVAVQAQKNEVAVKLGRAQATHEALLTERRHRQIEIGRLKNPGRLVDLARGRLGMTPQPAGIWGPGTRSKPVIAPPRPRRPAPARPPTAPPETRTAAAPAPARPPRTAALRPAETPTPAAAAQPPRPAPQRSGTLRPAGTPPAAAAAQPPRAPAGRAAEAPSAAAAPDDRPRWRAPPRPAEGAAAEAPPSAPPFRATAPEPAPRAIPLQTVRGVEP
jgi:hypothetical protein